MSRALVPGAGGFQPELVPRLFRYRLEKIRLYCR